MTPDKRPERAPISDVTWTEALLWLNDRCGSIISVAVSFGDEPVSSAILLMGDTELQHWSKGEAPDYVASQMGEDTVGSYRLGERALLNVRQLVEKSLRCRANNLHLVVDLGADVSLRISGFKPDL